MYDRHFRCIPHNAVVIYYLKKSFGQKLVDYFSPTYFFDSMPVITKKKKYVISKYSNVKMSVI